VLEAVPLTDADSDAAGILLAQRHARERQLVPLLPEAYEDPVRAADLVRRTLSFCDGVSVRTGAGDLAGFLTAFDSVVDQSSPMARYSPARASTHLVHGHAVAGGAAPGPTYGALFAELADRAFRRGITDYVVHVPASDPEIEAAWAALGFGRMSVYAVRELEPLGREPALRSDVRTRVATAEDLDTVDRLVDEEAVFHARSPIFRPYLRDATAAKVRAELAAELAADDHAFVLASRDGLDVGVLSIGPGLGSPLYVPDGAAYIGATAVLEHERGVGAGAALVTAALDWARDHGYRAACLHFATTNRTSTAFWTGLRFTPVMVHLRRVLDGRLAVVEPQR
jgi:GNAT superfamily N-acetyltransferase